MEIIGNEQLLKDAMRGAYLHGVKWRERADRWLEIGAQEHADYCFENSENCFDRADVYRDLLDDLRAKEDTSNDSDLCY